MLDFTHRLVHYSHSDVSFNSICPNMLEGIKKFNLLLWFKKNRLETLAKGNDVKALIKTSNCENLFLYFSEKVKQIAVIAMLFRFSVTKQSLENGFGFPNDQKYTRYPLALKFNVTLAQQLRLVILYCFKWKLLSDDRRQQMKLEIWCGWAHPYKTIAKVIVHGIISISEQLTK